MWNKITENQTPDTIEVLGQSDKWISECNPNGIRIGFIKDKQFISANWDNNQDTYYNEYGMPEKYMKIPIKYERLEKIFDKLFDEIKHGDLEHQEWLKKKIDDFIIKLKY